MKRLDLIKARLKTTDGAAYVQVLDKATGAEDLDYNAEKDLQWLIAENERLTAVIAAQKPPETQAPWECD